MAGCGVTPVGWENQKQRGLDGGSDCSRWAVQGTWVRKRRVTGEKTLSQELGSLGDECWMERKGGGGRPPLAGNIVPWWDADHVTWMEA